MSAWVKSRVVRYDPDEAPAILMPEQNHLATFGVYNKWHAEMRAKLGGTFDWILIAEDDAKALAEKMLDAAEVPTSIRQEYWTWYDRMKVALEVGETDGHPN